MEEPTTEKYLEARTKIVDDLKDAVIGNDWRSDEERKLNFNPLYHFVSGILYPIDNRGSGYLADQEVNEPLNENDSKSENEDEIESNINPNARKKNTDEEDEDPLEQKNIIDQSVQAKQSSFGINCITSLDEELAIYYGFSQYEHKTIEVDEGKKSYYLQKKVRDSHTFLINSNSLHQEQLIGDGLVLRIDSRISANQVISTISISHQMQLADDSVYSLENCFFQIGLEISSLKSSFLPIKTPLQAGSGAQAKSLDLLFRDKLSYATGNGCATDWEDKKDCKKIWTDFLPSFEVKSIEPTQAFDLKMEQLANIDNQYTNEEAFSCLDDICIQYKEWINEQEEAAKELDEHHKETAKNHIASAKSWLKRIETGVEIIKNDEDASLAFRLANHAMLIQANRLSLLERKKSKEDINCLDRDFFEDLQLNTHKKIKYSWRPFQLAFVVGMIPDIVDPEAKDSLRDQVDLIWFPTGGGKTEAYLGVLAFSILHRRIIDPEDAGVVALMRYTLRLLTSDQFRRSSALICALDYIRKEKILDIDLGEENISIGLWIGSKGNPATHANAKAALNDLDIHGNQAFMLDECPWCKSHLTDPNDSGYERTRGKVIIRCTDSSCHFYESLPIYLWQEAIFDEKPSLLLGTIDNFAKLAWLPEAIDLFAGNDVSPPDLIIQDELHLISGPMGSMVGLYETVLLKLLEQNGKGPKIIGATATLSLEGSQSKSLYRGRDSSVFPPQVLNWGDSFFAKERQDKYGRQYIGFFGSSKGSMIESAFSASIPLLQAPNKILPVLAEDAKKGDTNLKISLRQLPQNSFFSIFHNGGDYTEYKVVECDDGKPNQVIILEEGLKEDLKSGEAFYPKPMSADLAFDPFGTLVWYFNSKRELAYISNQTNRMRDSLKSNARYEKFGQLGTEKAPYRFARHIKQVRELTGRLTQDEIQAIISELRKPWTQVMGEQFQFTGIDILFSTNMISVGVDISRLGLMLMHGHPRTTSEYIQATSRVGRRYPGLVTTVYNHHKSKDRSTYEMFKNYHQSFYRFVEAVSVTPFSSGARARALPAIFVSLARHFGIGNPSLNDNSHDNNALDKAREWILSSLTLVDPEEYNNTEKELDRIIKKWKSRLPTQWGKMGGMTNDEVRLLGVMGDPESDLTVFKAPISMRSVDAGVGVEFFKELEEIEEDEY
jgi:hypothetical protein